MANPLDHYVQLAMADKMRRDEATIRELLGRWVSGLEPAIAYCDGEIIGLTLAGAQLGDTPFVLRVRE